MARQAWRSRTLLLTLCCLSLVVFAGCGRPDGAGTGGAGGAGVAEPPATASPTAEEGHAEMGVVAAPTTAAPKPSARPSPSPTRRPRPAPGTTVKVVPKPPPTSVPAPPPPPPPSPGCTGPHYEGTNAPESTVAAALVSSGATQYWLKATVPPKEADGTVVSPLPEITIPANLMKAVAEQESGWQSAIIACDGGIGVMQVMPDTATWMNNRFATSYDVRTVTGNIALGTEYLQWLVMYFGLYYFDHTFDVSDTSVTNSGYTLLDAVVSAYNVGYGAVERDDGTIAVPNPQYVSNVKALMTRY